MTVLLATWLIFRPDWDTSDIFHTCGVRSWDWNRGRRQPVAVPHMYQRIGLYLSISLSFLRKLPWWLMTQMPKKSSLCVYSGPSNKLDVAHLSTDVGLSSSGHSNESSELTHHHSNSPILGSFFIRQHCSKALFYWNDNTFFQQFETGRKYLYIFLLPTTTLSHFMRPVVLRLESFIGILIQAMSTWARCPRLLDSHTLLWFVVDNARTVCSSLPCCPKQPSPFVFSTSHTPFPIASTANVNLSKLETIMPQGPNCFVTDLSWLWKVIMRHTCV